MERMLMSMNMLGTSVCTFIVCETVKHNQPQWAAFAAACGLLCMANNFYIWSKIR